jgi:hypothetical protein
MKKPKTEEECVSFHGGCFGCSQQLVHGFSFCKKCMFFDSDWNLPNLSNKPLTRAEEVKKQLGFTRCDQPQRNW